jgi:hypothetical protein
MSEVIQTPDWLVERMDKISKMPPPTLDEVKAQLEASEQQRAIFDSIPVMEQKSLVELLHGK